MKAQFNGERLKKARIYRGLTVAELAESVVSAKPSQCMRFLKASQQEKNSLNIYHVCLDFLLNSFMSIQYPVQRVQYIFGHFLLPARNTAANRL